MGRFADRIARLQKRLVAADVDGAVVGTGPTARYFTGFAGERDRHLLLFVDLEGGVTFVSPSSYAGQVERRARVGEIRSVSTNSASAVVDGLAASLSEPSGTYLVDDRIPAGEAYRLERTLADATFDLLSPVVGPMRAVKDDTELEALRRAATVTDGVSVAIRELGSNAVGMTERELAVEIRTRLHERGSEGVAFPVVVAAGPNGALPTAYRHGDREIRPGEPVVLDFGGFFDGYASDQTRTVVFDGSPTPAFVGAHRVVHDALRAGIEAAKPGMTGGELDEVVRSVVSDAGYGDRFLTGTGHGVGLRAHEPPAISPDSADELEPGMVFSIEPGIYVEDEFGVRLETLVALTEDGPEALNTSPYTWEPL